MTSKLFRIDWYPHAAFIDFHTLKADHIGVLMQITNLIYLRGGPISFDAKKIGRDCHLTKPKCERIIQHLINEDHLYLTSDGKISKRRCEIELKKLDERREIHSRNGEKGSKERWRNKVKQQDKNSQANYEHEASTNPSHSISDNINDHPDQCSGNLLSRFGTTTARGNGKYNIDDHLTDAGRERSRKAAPGKDQHYLKRKYNDWINNGGAEEPDNPDAAYVGWCASYMKRNEP